jgi:hypothetical protein
MAQDMDDFSHLWQRHLTVLRDDFSSASMQALPSLPSLPRSRRRSLDHDNDSHGQGGTPAHPWDEKMDSIVDALDEITL